VYKRQFVCGANPPGQTLSISNSGFGNLNWQISEDCSWLSIEPNSGSSAGESDNVNLSVDITGLTAGIYTFNLTVSDPNASNSPQIVGISLTVFGPEIGLSATQFEFTATEGGTNPPGQTLGISNSGQCTLNWQISEDCSWLSVEPNSGSSTGEIDDVSLTVDISGLTVGAYSCDLTISDPNAPNNPQVVSVNLFIGNVFQVPSEYGTIQEAIDIALNGSVVIVAPGTYTGPGNRDIDFKGKIITVQSTDPKDPCVVAATIIDCNATSDHFSNFHQGFYFHSGEASNSILAGLTITNGYENYGGGIRCSGSSPTITSCILSGNGASGYGGGMYNENSNPTITNCIFTGNKSNVFGGGGMYNKNSNLTITNCTITYNISVGNYDGGGMHNQNSNLTITNCTIAHNIAESDEEGGSGGGISNDSSSLNLTNCTFSDNLASGIINNTGTGHGGGMFNRNNSNVTMINCTFNNNSASKNGGGVYTYSSGLSLTNCTFSNNSAGRGGGGMYNYSSSPTLSNCILWGNYGSQIYNFSNSVPTISFSDVQGGWTGTGNINADPCFVNSLVGDLHLLPDSPCINTGNPAFVARPDETDIDSEPRVMLGRVDMGADEFNPFEIDFTVVNKRRVGRTLFEYDCDITLTNISNYSVRNVQLDIVRAPENLIVIDPAVTFGDIEISPGESATSVDMCTFRVDRSQATEPTEIIWKSTCEVVGGASGVQDTISGVYLLLLDNIADDITGNGKVNFEDLKIIADQWLQPPGTPSADIAPLPNGDNIVDFLDFSVLARNWLRGTDE
jgi:hypothetical protein